MARKIPENEHSPSERHEVASVAQTEMGLSALLRGGWKFDVGEGALILASAADPQALAGVSMPWQRLPGKR